MTGSIIDRLEDRPAWFVENLERYARARAALELPEAPAREGWAEVREDLLTRIVAHLVAAMNGDEGYAVAFLRYRDVEGCSILWPAGAAPRTPPDWRGP